MPRSRRPGAVYLGEGIPQSGYAASSSPLGCTVAVSWVYEVAIGSHIADTQPSTDASSYGTGGAVALLLTARRQRYTELTLIHTTSGATERRITELYTKAADQLGSDKAPVRLAGLHALERLAQNTPEQLRPSWMWCVPTCACPTRRRTPRLARSGDSTAARDPRRDVEAEHLPTGRPTFRSLVGWPAVGRLVRLDVQVWSRCVVELVEN
jgi:hypothetical protein